MGQGPHIVRRPNGSAVLDAVVDATFLRQFKVYPPGGVGDRQPAAPLVEIRPAHHGCPPDFCVQIATETQSLRELNMIRSLCLRDSVATVGCAKILRTDRQATENTGSFTYRRKN